MDKWRIEPQKHVIGNYIDEEWQSIFDGIIKRYSVLKDLVVPPDELHLCFQFEPKTPDEVKMICRKAVLYATHSYLIVPYGMSVSTTALDPYNDDLPVDRWYSCDSWLQQFWQENAIFSKYVDILPKLTLMGSSLGYETYNDLEIDRLLGIKFRSTYLTRQIFEKGMDTNEGVQIFLPHLRGVNDKELLKIRSGELSEHYTLFQRATSKLLRSNIQDGESTLFSIMQEVDENVIRLNEKVKSLKIKKWFDVMELAMIPTSLILTFTVPADISQLMQHFTAVLGAGTVLSFIRRFSEWKQEKRSLETDPFFVPWHLAQAKT